MTTNIPALRMCTADGALYCRPKAIEATIAAVSQIPANEVAEHSRITDRDANDYVPTECLLHFVRNGTFSHDEHAARELFAALLDRVSHLAVPELTRREARSTSGPQSVILIEIREAIIEKFEDMLCADQTGYDERLDFFECRFNAALATLRLDARKKIRRRYARTAPLVIDDESNDPSGKVEDAFRKSIENDGFLYRSDVVAAINSLPAEERRVIKLLYYEGLPIESEDDQVLSIVKVEKCAEKTVRNRRDRALKRIRDALTEGDK